MRPDQVSLGVLVDAVPRDAVDEAVAVCGVREKRCGRQAARARDHVSDVGVVPVPRRRLHARSRPRSPGRWTGGAAGTRPGRCRPPGRSPRPGNGWAATCSPELFERTCGPVAGKPGPTAGVAALGTARGSFLRRWRLLAIDGFEIDLPDSKENAAEFGYAGSGDEPLGVPQGAGGRVGRVRHPRVRRRRGRRLLRRGEDPGAAAVCRGCAPMSCSPPTAASTPGRPGTPPRRPGPALLWRAPTQLDLPVVRVLADGTYLHRADQAHRSGAGAGSGCWPPPAPGRI